MNVTEILPLHFKLELPEGLDEWHALYVSDSPSQLQTHKHWQWPSRRGGRTLMTFNQNTGNLWWSMTVIQPLTAYWYYALWHTTLLKMYQVRHYNRAGYPTTLMSFPSRRPMVWTIIGFQYWIVRVVFFMLTVWSLTHMSCTSRFLKPGTFGWSGCSWAEDTNVLSCQFLLPF